MITRPVRERSLAGIGEMVDAAVRASGFDEVGLLSLSSRRPLRDRRDHQGAGRPLRGHQHLAVAALHPGGRVQHRPRQGDLPQRPPLRADLRPRGRLGADPARDQQDGVGGGPHPHRQRGVRAGLAAGEALLHVRAAHRGGRRRPGDRGHGAPRDPGRARGVRAATTCAARSPSAGSCPSRTPRSSGPRRPTRTSSTSGCASCARPSTADRKLGRNIGMRYHDGQPSLIEGLLARGDRRVGAVIERVWREGGRFDGWSEHFSYERWIAAAAAELEPMGVSLDWFTTRERGQAEVLPWDHLDSGPGARLALGGLAGRAGGPRAGRLPLDAVLRLRRVPVHRHRHRGGPERHDAAAADGGQSFDGVRGCSDRGSGRWWLTLPSSRSPSGSPTSATWVRSPGSGGRGWRSAPGNRSTIPASRRLSGSGGGWSSRGGRSGWPRWAASAAASPPWVRSTWWRSSTCPGPARRAGGSGMSATRSYWPRSPEGGAEGTAGGGDRTLPRPQIPASPARPDSRQHGVLPACGLRALGGEPAVARPVHAGGAAGPLTVEPLGLSCAHGPTTPRRSGEPRTAHGAAHPRAVRQAWQAAASCPTATSPAVSSARSGARVCRCPTRTGSARTRGCPGSGRHRPGRRVRPSTWRSG